MSGVFIIAELGINHAGDMATAHALIHAAYEAGADAVKFQSFTADELGYDQTLTDYLSKCQLTEEMHLELKLHCDDFGIEFMSTPFDADWADFLVRLGVKRLKVSSGKVSDRAFMAHLRTLKLPLIISNGMCDPETFRDVTQPRDTVLYCVSRYPAPLHAIDFRRMAKLRHSFFSVGFSDHTANPAVGVLAAAAGAEVVEAHLAMSRDMPGPDIAASLTPAEFSAMVEGVRSVGK